MSTRTALIISGTSIALGAVLAISQFDFNKASALKEAAHERNSAINEMWEEMNSPRQPAIPKVAP